MSEWASYYTIEPFGNVRSDIQSGIIASTIANCNRTKSSQKMFPPLDIMPIGEHKLKPEEAKEDDIRQFFMNMTTVQESK